MNERPSLPWPPWMIALDVVGTLLLAFGLYALVGPLDADGIRGIAIGAIIVGVSMMLPLLVALARLVISRAKSG